MAAVEILSGEICRLVRESRLHLIVIKVRASRDDYKVVVDISAAPFAGETTNDRLALLLSSPPSWPLSAALYGAGLEVGAPERGTLYTALHWAGMKIFLEREPPGKRNSATGATMVFGPAGVSIERQVFDSPRSRSILQRFRKAFAA